MELKKEFFFLTRLCFKCIYFFKRPINGFTGGSDGKMSALNEGDLSSIPGLERSPGGGNDLEQTDIK